MSSSGGKEKPREEDDSRPGSYSSSIGGVGGHQSRFRSVSDLRGGGDPFGSYASSQRSIYTSHMYEEPSSGPDIECVVSLNNRLDVTAISYIGDHAIVVLDKACIGHPFCDFVHIEDRDAFRNATFCALMIDGGDTGREDTPGAGRREYTTDEIVGLLGNETAAKSLAVVRLKDIKESFYRFRLTVRIDPRQPFLNGNNDLIVGLERVSPTAASSMVGTPGLNDCYSTRSPSVQSNYLNINLTSNSPRAQGDMVLPSFAVLSAGVAPPNLWGRSGPIEGGVQSAAIPPLPGMEGLKITPTVRYSDLESEGSPSSAGHSGFSGMSERR